MEKSRLFSTWYLIPILPSANTLRTYSVSELEGLVLETTYREMDRWYPDTIMGKGKVRLCPCRRLETNQRVPQRKRWLEAKAMEFHVSAVWIWISKFFGAHTQQWTRKITTITVSTNMYPLVCKRIGWSTCLMNNVTKDISTADSKQAAKYTMENNRNSVQNEECI